MGPPPSRYPCQQASPKEIAPVQLLQVCKYTHPVETQQEANCIHVGCGQFWD
jgi:hypothetical protein